MKVGSVCVIVALAGGISIAAWQRQQINVLREEEKQLIGRAVEAERLRKQSEIIALQKVDPDEVAKLQAQRSALAKARSEVAALRQSMRLNESELRDELEALQTRIESEQKRSDLLEAEARAKEKAKEVTKVLREIALFVRFCSNRNPGSYPASFEEIKGTVDQSNDPNIKHIFESLTSRADLPHGTSISSFEFIIKESHAPASGINDKALPIIREREARRLPNGSSVRTHLFADGRIEEVPELNEGL